MRILVAYDGTLQAKDALRYGLKTVREKGGDLMALYVYDSGLFAGYDSIPGAEDLALKDAHRFVEEAKAIVKEEGQGLWTRVVSEEGDPQEEILKWAVDRHVNMLLCPPRYKSAIGEFKKVLADQGKTPAPNFSFNGFAGVGVAVAV